MSNDTFKWDDSLVAELLRLVTSYVAPQHWKNKIKDFKLSKMPRREWEVLEIENPLGGRTYKEDKWSWESIGINSFDGFKIRIVKRMSDGEVFSVGEKVGCTINPVEFFIDTIEISCEPYLIGAKTNLMPLRNARKLTPQPKPYKYHPKEEAYSASKEDFMDVAFPEPKNDETKTNLSYETVKQWLSHQVAIAPHGKNSYTFLYRGIACYGEIANSTELIIRPQNVNDNIGNGTGGAITITFFREPEQPKKERIEVIRMGSNAPSKHGIGIIADFRIPEIKFAAIKAAIEGCLNDEDDINTFNEFYARTKTDQVIAQLQQQMKEAEERAFNAAREFSDKSCKSKFYSFKDYLNSKS